MYKHNSCDLLNEGTMIHFLVSAIFTMFTFTLLLEFGFTGYATWNPTLNKCTCIKICSSVSLSDCLTLIQVPQESERLQMRNVDKTHQGSNMIYSKKKFLLGVTFYKGSINSLLIYVVRVSAFDVCRNIYAFGEIAITYIKPCKKILSSFVVDRLLL